jgi:hypothetical protein
MDKGRMNPLTCQWNSGGEDSCPDSGRGLPVRPKSTQAKLPFANAMYELDDTDSDRSGSKAFQAQHGPQPGLYVTMVLLD